MSDDDSMMATGISGGVFGNEPTPEVDREKLAEEREFISSIVPNAQAQVDGYNRELAQMNNLAEFVKSLGCLPTDLSDQDFRAKLEARFGYVVYLQTRKNGIVNGMNATHHPVNDAPVDMPLPEHFADDPWTIGSAQEDSVATRPTWREALYSLLHPWRPRM